MNGNPYYESYSDGSRPNSLEHYGVSGMKWRNHKATRRELHTDPGYLASETYKTQNDQKRKAKLQDGLRGKPIKINGDSKVNNLSDRVVNAGVKVLDDIFSQDHGRSMQNLHNYQTDVRRARNAR